MAPTTDKKKSKPWLTSHPTYKEFVLLCEKHQWQKRTYLPHAGGRSQDAIELDEFAKRGLGEEDSIPFTRYQLNRKFNLWKESINTPIVVRQLDEMKIQSTKELLDSFLNTQCWRMNGDIELAPGFSIEQVLGDGALFPFIDYVRTSTISSVNNIICNFSGDIEKDNDLFVSQKNAINKRFVNDLVDFVSHCSFCSNDNAPASRVIIRSFANPAFLELQILISRAIQMGIGSLDTIIKDILQKYQNTNPYGDESNLLTKTIYYISGWVLKIVKSAIQRGKGSCSTMVQALKKIEYSCIIPSSQLERISDCPTDRVVCTNKRSKKNPLNYCSSMFYNFICLLEKICEDVLTESSIIIYGSKLPDLLVNAMSSEKFLIERLKKTCGCEKLSDIEGKEATIFISKNYMKMRSRDFIRSLLGREPRSLAQGTRPILGVLAQGGKVATNNVANNWKNKNQMVCYFCKSNNHLAKSCDLRCIAPQNYEETKHIFIDDTDKEIMWHWCSKCGKWQGHSENNHIDIEEESEEIDEEMETIVSTVIELNIKDDE